MSKLDNMMPLWKYIEGLVVPTTDIKAIPLILNHVGVPR